MRLNGPPTPRVTAAFRGSKDRQHLKMIDYYLFMCIIILMLFPFICISIISYNHNIIIIVISRVHKVMRSSFQVKHMSST